MLLNRLFHFLPQLQEYLADSVLTMYSYLLLAAHYCASSIIFVREPTISSPFFVCLVWLLLLVLPPLLLFPNGD